jgi:hypothetical protein
MKKLATAFAAIALIAKPAFAADMAVKAPPPAPGPAPVNPNSDRENQCNSVTTRSLPVAIVQTTSLTIGRASKPIEHSIDLTRHDKSFSCNPLIFLVPQRDDRFGLKSLRP